MDKFRSIFLLLALASGAPAQKFKPKSLPKPGTSAALDPHERALQYLNRFTFGPRPGDLDKVTALTSEKWFEAQLTPGSIDDGALAKRLTAYPTLALSPAQILDIFPDRGNIQQLAEGKRQPPLDQLSAAVYTLQLYKLQAEQVNKKNPPPESTDAEKAGKKKTDQATAARLYGELIALPKNQRMAYLITRPIPDQIAVADNLTGEQRTTLNVDLNGRERETLLAMQGGVGNTGLAVNELTQSTMLREILSERQLLEVMTDFWFNHFNIYAPKDSDQWYTTQYVRDTIRPHALGKFRDLLLATAESPAMMIYLDNWLSIGPNSPANGVSAGNPRSKPGNKGLNENYGREVMELHTVGVGGGYSQADVTHLAAILTGWTVDNPGRGGTFLYDPRKHEPGTKQWFGYTLDEQGRVLFAAPGKPVVPNLLSAAEVVRAMPSDTEAPGYEVVPTNVPPDGMKQGVTALALLAASPKTAHFISYLLAQRFLADDPPASVVDRMAAVYLAKDGDVKSVLRALVSSAEFNQKRYFRNKVKTPIEFIASAFRATSTDPVNPGALVNALRDMGQPPFGALPPTGYYITADRWMNTSALVGRLNFADQLTHNKFANQKFDSSRILALGLMSQPSTPFAKGGSAPPRTLKLADSNTSPPQPTGSDLVLQVLERTLIGAEVSTRSEEYIHAQLTQQNPNNPTDTLNLLTALLLGSPDFQLR